MTPLAIIQLCLAKTGLELSINTSTSIKPDGTIGLVDPLAIVLKDVVTYAGMSCYEVLENLLQGCRIFQRDGEWWVISNDMFSEISIGCFNYTSAGTYTGLVNFDPVISGHWFEGDGDMSFLPALKQITVKQDYGYKPNLINNGSFESLVDGDFENWTPTGVTPEQRGIDEKYVYLPGSEQLDGASGSWYDGDRTKYLLSDAIPVKISTSNIKLAMSFALMGPIGSTAYVFIGAYIEADAGDDYALQAYVYEGAEGREIKYRWTTSTYKLPVPVSAWVRKNENWPFSDTYFVQPDYTAAYPHDQIEENFKNFNCTIEGGIPNTGTLRLYLFLAHPVSGILAGSCFKNMNLNVVDENDENFPTETELIIINDLENNFVPSNIEIRNGDLPDITNKATIYQGGFFNNNILKAPTTAWQLGSSTAYTYADLIARIIAAEMVTARQARYVKLADVTPGTAIVYSDDSKKFVEAGITYNDRMQTIDGRFVEVLSLNVTAFTTLENVNYKATSGGSSVSSTPALPTSFFDLLDAGLPRANVESLDAGINQIAFDKPFPVGVEYVLDVYTYNSSGIMVYNQVTAGSEDEEGFELTVKKACTLRYVATPKK